MTRSWRIVVLIVALLGAGCARSQAAFTDVERTPQSLTASDSWGPPPTPSTIRIESRRYDTDGTNGLIHVGLRVVNTGATSVDLRRVTVRYWFTGDGASSAFIAECYYANLGCAPGGPVTPAVVEAVPAKDGGDRYIEVRFASGTIPPGANTGDAQVAARTAGGEILDERNDYSRPAATSYRDSTKVTAYDGGVLVWGEEPRPLPEGDRIEVSYANLDQGHVSSSINPGLDLRNEGDRPLDLARVKIRYWFSRDGAISMSSWCDWAQIGCETVTRTIRPAVPLRHNGDTYLEVGFTTRSLGVGSTTGPIMLRMSTSTYGDLNEKNDYSYDKRANYDINRNITAYIDGVLVWGDEPRAMTAEEIAALFPSTTTSSSTTTTTTTTTVAPVQPIAPSTTATAVQPTIPSGPTTTATAVQPTIPAGSTTTSTTAPPTTTTTAGPAPAPQPLVRPGQPI